MADDKPSTPETTGDEPEGKHTEENVGVIVHPDDGTDEKGRAKPEPDQRTPAADDEVTFLDPPAVTFDTGEE